MSDINKLADGVLDAVSGGAGVTPWGNFPVDDAGNVAFTDKNGVKMNFSKGEWDFLIGKYSGPTIQDKIAALSTVPAGELNTLLVQGGLRK